jgi:hypothetical protein
MVRRVSHPKQRSAPAARRFVRAFCMFVALPLAAGCYGYVPVEFDALAPPEQVQARLNPSGVARMSELLGSRESVIQGELVAISPEGFSMAVSTGSLQQGFHFQTLHQELVLPREQVLVMERRKLDAFRTAGVGVVAVAVAGIVIQKLVQDNRDQRAPTPPPGPGEVRVPTIRGGLR